MNCEPISNTMMRTRWILGCLLGLVWGGVALGQAPNEVSVTFTVFKDTTDPIEGVFFVGEGGRAAEVTFRRGQRSFSFRHRGGPVIHFFRKSVDASGNEVRVPVGAATLSPQWREALLFFFPNPQWPTTGPEFFVQAMNDSRSAIPTDHLVFFNATGATLLGVFGQQEIELGVGATGPFDLGPFLDSSVPIGLVVKDGESFREVYVSRLTFSPGSRTILLLMPPRREGSYRIMVRGIYDFSSEPPPPAGG